MKRWTLLSIILFAAVGFTQEIPAKPAPGGSDGILGPQLIAWSELQKPQPVPQRPEPVPVPDSKTDKQAGPTEDTPQAQPDSKSPAEEKQEPAAQTLTGTVVKVGDKYVLKTVDKQSYEIDNQEKARVFEGKQVRIIGSLDRANNVIRVTSIELMS